jgi:hypothetical protein
MPYFTQSGVLDLTFYFARYIIKHLLDDARNILDERYISSTRIPGV